MASLTTTSGYVVELKDELDTAGYRAIQRVNLAAMMMRPGMEQSDLSVSGEVILDAEDVALKHMVLSVTLPDGSPAPDPVQAVAQMPFQDGEAVYAAVNALTSPQREDQAKNAPTASSTT